MDADARRDEIQKRLRDLQRERSMQDNAVGEICRTVGEKVLTIRAGDRVRITDDVGVFDASEKVFPIRDPLRKVYMGERGDATVVLADFMGCGEAVEVQFVDGCKHVFCVNCLDGFSVKQDRGARTAQPAQMSHVELLRREPAPNLPDKPVAAPSWASLRKHSSLKSVATSKTSQGEEAEEHNDQSNVEGTAAPLPVVEEPLQGTSQVPPIALGQIVGSGVSEPKGCAIVPRASSSDAPKCVSPAPVLALKVTPRTAADDDADDDLLRSPRDDFLRTESWAQDKRFSPAIAAMSTVAVSQLPSQIPPCPPQYTPKFPLGDARSLIPRPQSESTGVKCCRLVTSEDYATCSPNTRRARTRDVAFRSHQSTLDAMLAACTTELGWGREGRRVTRLFIAPQGQEVMFADMVRDGCDLVASEGTPFIAPPIPSNSARSAHSTGKVQGRPTSPFSVRPRLPAVVSVPVIQKPKIVRVYVNGEYGDIQGDLLPFRTVTIRPTCKTMKSVCTMLDRELQWNTLGRHVDILYTSRGDVISSVDSIVDGESIVVSTGDRFMIPRSTSVLHREIKAMDEDAIRRVKSPVRPRSPYR